MGWASGSQLAEDVWDLFKKYIPKNKTKKIANKLIDLFEQKDCDTMQECQELYYEAAERKDDFE